MVKRWHTFIKDHEVYVTQLPNGRWLGGFGLKTSLDSAGTTHKQEVFDTVEEALKFVGYPVGIVPLPRELMAELAAYSIVDKKGTKVNPRGPSRPMPTDIPDKVKKLLGNDFAKISEARQILRTEGEQGFVAWLAAKYDISSLAQLSERVMRSFDTTQQCDAVAMQYERQGYKVTRRVVNGKPMIHAEK